MGLFNTALGWLFNDIGNLAANFTEPLLEKQLEINREGRKTAYQDTMYSMKEAGLNPMLAMNNGASQMTNITPDTSGLNAIAGLGNGISKGIGTALQARQQKNDNKLTQANVDYLNAQTETQETVRQLNLAQASNQFAQKILNDKQSNWYDKRMANQIETNSINAIAALGQSKAAQKNANVNYALMPSAKAKNWAETKYTNERARGLNIYDFDAWGQNFKGILENVTKKKYKNWIRN